ncbi:MAG: hypothetical protein OHK0024_13920 [Thalassobaculales bacterium]
MVPAGLRQHRPAGGRAGFLAAALAAAPGADAVLCGHLNLLPAARLARAAAGLLGRRPPLLAMIHGIEAWQPRRGVGPGTIDHVLSVSAVTLDRFRGWSGFPAERATVTGCGIDLQRFRPDPVAAPAPGRRVLLSLGRLHPAERYKGFDRVIAVLPRLLATVPGLVYRIAGEGGDRPRLEALARQAGVAGRVEFLGHVAEPDKPALYREADAFVLAGRGEGLGIVLLEAMACGVPIVASRLDGSREAAGDGRRGEICDPDDEADLVAAILRALARPRGQRPPDIDSFADETVAARLRAQVLGVLGSAAGPASQ